ncbi:MAG: hypothetical protein BLM47_10805 [Candidatus Reconcilbacillus cellulovorans]|uniref:Enoyl reductase (ER) domain-containing protein n=1 Tax=Candidatus Reconcilbacillus cellulovorans TaxID=1906605 RepID=A0A2A6DYF6_9BACL|nr:MAG: hypothetical protein BLM47_10805 [Candidatus Reconcilbacillus cellulovorans]
MKALVYENVRELRVRDWPDPTPGEDEVVIRVAWAGICGSDLSGYLGHNSLRVPPLVMGHEFSGIVIETGSRVTRWKPGDRVAVNPLVSCGRCRKCLQGKPQLCASRQIIGAHRAGAFAEKVAVPERNVFVWPDSEPLERAALAEPLACAVHIARLAALSPTERLLVLGAGPIGMLVMLVAQVYGVKETIVMERNPSRLRMAAELGATTVTSEEALRELAGKRGFDVAVDAVGVRATRRLAVETAALGGTVVLSGLHEADSELPVNVAVRNELNLRGAFCYEPRDFETALEWLASGKIRLDDGFVFAPLDEGQACFERLLAEGDVLKILLSPEKPRG